MTLYDDTIVSPEERKEMFTMTSSGYPTPTVKATEIMPDGEIKEYNLTGEEVSEILRQRGYERKRLEDANKSVNNYLKLISNLETNIQGWTEDEAGADEIIRDLCEMFELNPIKTIEFTATITVNGFVDVPLHEVSTFELEDLITDSLYGDTNDYSISINDSEVTSVEEC